MSCKFEVFMTVPSDWPIQVKFTSHFLFKINLITLAVFYYVKAFTDTRAVSLDMLLDILEKATAGLCAYD